MTPLTEEANFDWYQRGVAIGQRLGWEQARKWFLINGTVPSEFPAADALASSRLDAHKQQDPD